MRVKIKSVENVFYYAFFQENFYTTYCIYYVANPHIAICVIFLGSKGVLKFLTKDYRQL